MTHRSWILCTLTAAACGSSDDYGYEPSVLRDDTFVIAEDEPLDLVRLKDNDDGDDTLRIVDGPLRGTIDGLGHRYAPPVGFFGVDRFTYTDYVDGLAAVDVKIVSDGIPYERAVELDAIVPDDLEIGDITGDGKPDVVTCDRSSSSFTVLENRTLAPEQHAFAPHRFEGGYTPVDVALADFDGDGGLDVVTAAWSSGLVVLRNARPAAGLVFDAPSYLDAGSAIAVATLDLDGDGALDVAALDDDGGLVHLWLNRSTAGRIAFASAGTVATPPGPAAMAVGDFDRDGRGDFAVLAEEPGVLAIYTNAGTSFTRTDRATGTRPRSLLRADFDDDGTEDFGVFHDDTALWIYENRAADGEPPTFDAARVLALPSVDGVAAVELDGERGIDLIASSYYGLGYHFHADAYRERDARIGLDGDAATLHVQVARQVDLDGAPPHEIVVGSSEGNAYASRGGVYVLYGR